MSDNTIPTHVCKTCQLPWPRTPEYWHKDKKSKDGLSYCCRPCAKAKSAAWLDKNRERNKESSKRYYHENPDKVREYRATHAEEIAAYKKQWRKDHPEEVKRHKQESAKRCRKHITEYQRKWKLANPESVQASHERRDKKAAKERSAAWYAENKEYALKR